MAKKATTIRNKIRDFSLGLPEAYEDFPWGERVTKVNKKVEVTGPVQQPPPPPDGAAANPKVLRPPSVQVESVKVVAESCT